MYDSVLLSLEIFPPEDGKSNGTETGKSLCRGFIGAIGA